MNKHSNKLIPELRFPEFRDAEEWKEDVLGGKGISSFVKERIPLAKLKLESYVSTENLLPDYAGVTAASKLPPAGSFTRFRKDDILISNIRPYLKKVWSSNMDGAASNDVIVIRADSIISESFLSFLLINDDFINYVMKGAKGVKMPRGDKSLMEKYPIAFPTKYEQQKIASCLSSVDDLITAHSQKLDALKAHKKGLMQQLFPAEGETVPKLRFPEFQDKGEWKIRELGRFITERNQLATEKIPLFSLTIENGVTPKTERYERSFLVNNVDDAYKLVCFNDFAYNPMNLRFGAIARHSGTEKVALSKYYNIFYCDDSVDSSFCEIYFRSHGMITHYNNVATGTLIEKRRVHFSDFVKFKIRFPTLSEQQKIANCLSSIDELITAQSQKLESLKVHKKGLMQGLFPQTSEL